MGEETLTEEYILTVNYMMQVNTVSAHRVIGYHKGQHCQVVADDLIAWHAGNDNPSYLGIEFTQPMPGDSFSQWQYDVGVAVVRAWAEKYGFPLDRWHIRRHQDTLQGQESGKSDPGECFDYEGFLTNLLGA
jgi:N-acetyl-anhydromuramyl-L-alanine amidase AmpD